MSEVEEEGVQIAATPQSEAHKESGANIEDAEPAFPEEASGSDLGLGDRIQIESRVLGRVIGKIYYFDDSLLRILPDGVSNRLYDFPITAEGIDPKLEIIGKILTEPTDIPSFIEQNRLRVGATVDTFTAEGEPAGSYKVDALNTDDDTAVFVAEDGTRLDLEFNYTGIPRDAPFEVLRVMPDVEPTPEENAATETEEEAQPPQEALDEFELPMFENIVEISTSERIYTETQQKNELLTDLLTLLDGPSQKNKNILKKLRSFVEITNGLVRQIVNYAPDGTPIGGKPTSITQLIDLLNTGKVPLSRPVLDTIRVLYLDHSSKFLSDIAHEESAVSREASSEESFTSDNFEVNYMSDSIKLAERLDKGSQSIPGAEGGLPKFFNDLNDVIQNLQHPWRSNDKTFVANTDTEFFRNQAPSEDTEIPGLNPSPDTKNPVQYTPELLDSKVRFSLQKALAASLRKSKTGKSIIALPADKAGLVSYLLFPLAVANALGSTRTCILSRDIGRSSSDPKHMSEVLDIVGSATEIPSATTLLNVGLEGNTLGNIDISEYLLEVLKQVQAQFSGFDDFRTILMDLGLDAYELNKETMDVLQRRVLQDIARVRNLITELRGELANAAEQNTQPFAPFLDEAGAQAFRDKLAGEPILSEHMKDLRDRTPSISEIDIAVLGYLLSREQDLTIATLGGQPQILDKERIRSNADAYLRTVKAALADRLKATTAGVRPIINKCQHVSTLTSIRKIKDDSERITLLMKFITRFQGETNGNYLDCIICDEHLICMHEVLQIQQALRPREKDVLQKELCLNMSGGSFNGRIICRNCGQPIAELEFDNHVEFNDDGAPVNGRQLEEESDETIEAQNAIQMGIGVVSDEPQFDNEAKQLCYNVAKMIFQRIGISPDNNNFKEIVEYSFLRIQTLDSRDDYNKKAAVAIKKGAKNVPDYDTYIKGYTVGSVASFVLINIQTRIPDYVVRYTLPGCEAGFSGFPLQGVENKTGLNYIACAVASITINEEPWNRTGFLKIRSEEVRRQTIAKFMEGIITKIVESEPTVQQKIVNKMDYLRETVGEDAAEGRSQDRIPFGFLPLQEKVSGTDAPTVVPEATQNSIGMRKVAAAWIREAHKHALKTAQLVRGNPYAETACCFGPINSPGSYWEANKISLPISHRTVVVSPFFRSSILFPHFTPRPIIEQEVDAPMNLAFRIFLKVCYKPPRMGYAHELGYNGTCDNCGLKLSSKYLYPDYSLQTSKRASAPIINIPELISDLEGQGVNVTPEFFQEVLDASHKNYIVPKMVKKEVTPASQLLSRLGDLQPAPVNQWRQLLSELITKLTALPKDANETDIAMAYGPVSDVAAEVENFIKRRLNSSSTLNILEKWMMKDSKLLAEILIAYIVVPLQRVISKFDPKVLVVSPFYDDLGYKHILELNGIITKHTEVIQKFASSFTKGIAEAKIEYFLKQIRGFLDFAEELQPARVPGGEIGMKYLRRMLFMGPFAELLDFNHVPPAMEGEVAAESLVDKSGTVLVSFMNSCIAKFSEESLSYSPEEIKLRIAKAKEKEKMYFIEDKDKMDDDEKRVDAINQALGIGKWAIGGSKLIYSYNAEQWDKEREERIRRGESDMNIVLGPPVITDVMGGSEFYDAEEGYNVRQESSDDF